MNCSHCQQPMMTTGTEGLSGPCHIGCFHVQMRHGPSLLDLFAAASAALFAVEQALDRHEGYGDIEKRSAVYRLRVELNKQRYVVMREQERRGKEGR